MFKKAVLALVLTIPFSGMSAMAGSNSSSSSDSNSVPDISGAIPLPNPQCPSCSSGK